MEAVAKMIATQTKIERCQGSPWLQDRRKLLRTLRRFLDYTLLFKLFYIRIRIAKSF